MKKICRTVSLILVLTLILSFSFAIFASAEDYVCPICGKDCGGYLEEEVRPADCMNPRQVKYYCGEYFYSDVFPDGEKDPYNHTELDYVKTVEPTCTESGYELYKCSDCGGEETHEILPTHPEGHNYVANAVKCTDTITSYRCTLCGDTKQETRTPAEHNYKAEPFSCYDECIDYHCTVCGALKQEAKTPSEHKWSAWNMIKEPTSSADGQRTRTCTVCGEIENETVLAGSTSKFIKGVALGDTTVQYKSSAIIEPEINSASGAKLKVEFKSSAPDIASVDNSGNVTAHKTGTTIITVTVTDTDGFKFEDTANITVKYAWWQWIINILLLGFLWY